MTYSMRRGGLLSDCAEGDIEVVRIRALRRLVIVARHGRADAHYGSLTGRPFTNTCLIVAFSSRRSPSVTITLAILPRSSEPRRSPAPARVAAFSVSALMAASFDSPLATVFWAFFKKSFGSDKPFDSNANSTPALSSAAGPFGALARSRSTLSDSSASGASDGRRVGKLRL